MVNTPATLAKFFFAVLFSFLSVIGFCQQVSDKLQKAYQQFQSDEQLKHAVSSLYVINAKTGDVVFDNNSQVGLAPASTQKIITAATAFDLLGKDYRYKTEFGFYKNDIPVGPITVKGFGDPSFGSPRFNSTRPDAIISLLRQKASAAGKPYSGMFEIDNTSFESQVVPDGWITEDVGNYYGAGAGGFNWKENQFDLNLKSSNRIGDSVQILGVNGKNSPFPFINELKSAAKGTGDNAYIYLPIGSEAYVVRGTIPAGENNFTVSGAIYDAPGYFAMDAGSGYAAKKISDKANVFYTYYSPGLDSLIYWFLKRSINLYGEALVKTFAYEKRGFGATDSGVRIMRDFWKTKGLDPDELNIRDGSGLSPLNRVTTHAEVSVLKYARQQPWFKYYLDAFPEFNNMKMKSGTINDVKSFCGYHTSGDGTEYIFSFIVNNYSGRSAEVVNMMYKVLDVLK